MRVRVRVRARVRMSVRVRMRVRARVRARVRVRVRRPPAVEAADQARQDEDPAERLREREAVTDLRQLVVHLVRVRAWARVRARARVMARVGVQ